jgi:hypothetical protein
MAKDKKPEKPEKGGRISLRIPPSLHAEAAFLAEQLGLDLNAFLNLVIRRALPHYRLEALTLRQQWEVEIGLLSDWGHAHPGRPPREFWDEYWQLQRAKEESVRDAMGVDFDNQDGALMVAAMKELLKRKEEHHEQGQAKEKGPKGPAEPAGRRVH